jgi:chromosome segregation ATPase
MRALHIFNLIGVLALAALCVFQWRINRDLNLRTNGLEKTRLEQTARIEEQDKQIKGQAADLDAFREHLQRATADLKSAESNLVVSRHQALQLTSERDQLKGSISEWSKAVAQRDEQLTRASEQLNKLADDRNDAVAKFNDLAAKHNTIVEDLNSRTREFNSLVDRYSALAKSSSQTNK